MMSNLCIFFKSLIILSAGVVSVGASAAFTLISQRRCSRKSPPATLKISGELGRSPTYRSSDPQPADGRGS